MGKGVSLSIYPVSSHYLNLTLEVFLFFPPLLFELYYVLSPIHSSWWTIPQLKQWFLLNHTYKELLAHISRCCWLVSLLALEFDCSPAWKAEAQWITHKYFSLPYLHITIFSSHLVKGVNLCCAWPFISHYSTNGKRNPNIFTVPGFQKAPD